MTIRPVLAAVIRPGTIVPSNDILHMNRHVALDVREDSGKVHILTNQGEWTFSPLEEVNFPRRADNSVRLWRADEPVRPIDMVIGDSIESADSPDITWTVRKIVSVGNYTEGSFGQVSVTMVSRLAAPVKVHRVHATNNYQIYSMEEPAKLAPARNKEVHYQAFGPYLDSVTGEMVMLALHPWGRGRWPRGLPEPGDILEIEPDLKIARPAAFVRYSYLGENSFNRHPTDPRYGSEPAKAVPSEQARADRVWARYQTYSAGV